MYSVFLEAVVFDTGLDSPHQHSRLPLHPPRVEACQFNPQIKKRCSSYKGRIITLYWISDQPRDHCTRYTRA